MAKTKNKSKNTTKAAVTAPQAAPASWVLPKLPGGAHDLAALEKAVGAPDVEIQRLLLRNHNEQGFYERGVMAESENILADVPRFVSSSVRILGGLDEGRRRLVLVPVAIFAVLVGEARALERMSEEHGMVKGEEDEEKALREATLKRVSREGVALRTRVLAGLRGAMGEARASEVREGANDASSPGALAKGLKGVARFIDEAVKAGDGDDKAALVAFGVGAERAEELRGKAKEILAASTVKAVTGKRVSQRALDIQDGRVLVLLDMVQRAFRLARRSDRSILMPELNRLAALFDTGGSAPAAKEARAAKGGAAPEAAKGTP